jgi:hypothetical protein
MTDEFEKWWEQWEEVKTTSNFKPLAGVSKYSIANAAWQEATKQAIAKKCANCGADLETYCKNCFNSGAKNQ